MMPTPIRSPWWRGNVTGCAVCLSITCRSSSPWMVWEWSRSWFWQAWQLDYRFQSLTFPPRSRQGTSIMWVSISTLAAVDGYRFHVRASISHSSAARFKYVLVIGLLAYICYIWHWWYKWIHRCGVLSSNLQIPGYEWLHISDGRHTVWGCGCDYGTIAVRLSDPAPTGGWSCLAQVPHRLRAAILRAMTFLDALFSGSGYIVPIKNRSAC